MGYIFHSCENKKVASNLKSMPLRFLHHVITSTVQCRTGSFTKMIANDILLLEMAITGTKINLACFIMNKMIKVMKDKDKEAKTLGDLNPRYELLPIGVTYNSASITTM